MHRGSRRSRTHSGQRLAAITACLIGLTAAAQEPGAESADDFAEFEGLLNEHVVSAASRTAESSSEAPATTWVISGTDLRRFGIQSIEEAIRYLGHGMISYEFDSRMNAAFGARGFLSDNLGLHIAVLIDGNQAGGSSRIARGTQQYLIPIELVEHLEVVIGPGSVIYGNSAMLGVINVVTKKPSTVEGVHGVVQASGGLPGDKWAENLGWGEAWARSAVYGGKTFRLAGSPFSLAWHAAVRADRQQGRAVFHGYPDVDYFADPLATHARENAFNRDFGTRLFGKATWGNWSFLGWGAFTGGNGVGPIEGSGQSSYYEPEIGLDAKWTTQLGDRGDLSLRTYAVVFDTHVSTPPNQISIDEQRCLDTVGTNRCADTIHYFNFKPFFEPVLSWDWNRNSSHVTTVGAQLFVDGALITTGVEATDGSRTRADEPILAPLPNAATYAQHIWRGDFGSLNLGLRGDLGIMGSAISPRAAWNRPLGEDKTLKLIFSTGFRTPVITERFLEIENFLVSNPDIRSERVYSGEIDFSQRLGRHNFQFALFGSYWDQLIAVRTRWVEGTRLSQFQNAHSIWSLGVNAGWQASSGPLDWGASLNYAPGRRQLPRGVSQFTDERFTDLRISRMAVERYGWNAFGNTFLPADGMPDAYATAHVSWALSENGTRLSLAGQLNSPRVRVNWSHNEQLIDTRNFDGPFLPWSVDLRGALETPLSDSVGLRLSVTGRSLATGASPPRVGNITTPLPNGRLGTTNAALAPLSAMAELNFSL